jgi:hypothetical protein
VSSTFECEFQHERTGERRVITVDLTPEEIASAAGRELYAFAYALRHSYRKRPRHFFHVAYGVRRVPLH